MPAPPPRSDVVTARGPFTGIGRRLGSSAGHANRDGLIEVACWCGRSTVRVTFADVRAGVTLPCHRDGCAA